MVNEAVNTDLAETSILGGRGDHLTFAMPLLLDEHAPGLTEPL
jgi:hypothetical protein